MKSFYVVSRTNAEGEWDEVGRFGSQTKALGFCSSKESLVPWRYSDKNKDRLYHSIELQS